MKQQRQETCCAAGGVHAGGLAEQDCLAAGARLGEGHAGEANGGVQVRKLEVRHRPPSVGPECYSRHSQDEEEKAKQSLSKEE